MDTHLKLREFSEDDIEGVVKLQNAQAPEKDRVGFEEVKSQLTDLARERGKNVTLAVRNGQIEGVVGWVHDKLESAFYAAPFWVSTQEAADVFARHLLNVGSQNNAKFIRVGAAPYQSYKQNAFRNSGYKKTFCFIDLEKPLESNQQVPKFDYAIVKAIDVDPEKYRELYNDSFKNVSNAPQINLDQAVETWADPEIHQDLSFVLSRNGKYIAFVLQKKNGYLDSIGVHSDLQKSRLGRKMYEYVFALAPHFGIHKITTLVADNNVASLKLHEKFAFKETERRQMWQYDFPKIHKAALDGFANEAIAYDRGRPDYPRDAIDFVTSHFPTSGQILDLAAGTGKFTKLILESHSSVVAVEPVEAMRKTFSKILPQTKILDGTAENIPFSNETFDVVTVAQAFHWFNGEAAIREIARVLKPFGKLVLVWNRRDESVAWVSELSKIINQYEGATPRYHSGEWRKAFEKNTMFSQLNQKTFAYQHPGTIQTVVDRVISISFIAALAENEKAKIAEQTKLVLEKDSQTRSQSHINFPYVTEVFIFEKRS